MQTYKDSVTDEIHEFDDDVTRNDDGTFVSKHGMTLNVPSTLEPYTVPAPTSEELLEKAKKVKKDEIRLEYRLSDNETVISENNTWNGGMDSVTKLELAKKNAELNGDNKVTFFDIDNNPQSLTFNKADNVIKDILAAAITNFTNKQTKMVEIDNAADETELDAITW